MKEKQFNRWFVIKRFVLSNDMRMITTQQLEAQRLQERPMQLSGMNISKVKAIQSVECFAKLMLSEM